jgi:hypothetical protein
MKRTLAQILHNRRNRDCGCSEDCFCQRTTLGRALRWYIPKRFHQPVSPVWKRAQWKRDRLA